MASGQDNNGKIRRYPAFCLLITLAIGLPHPVCPETVQYRPAVPVIDYIEKERPQGNVIREIKTLQEPGFLFKFALSQEFLAALLSFLVLFQATYIYFKYVRPSSRMSSGKRKRHRTSSSRKPPKPEPRAPERPVTSPAGSQEKKEDAATEQESEGEVFELQQEEEIESGRTIDPGQLRAERLEHARRIHHLLDRL